MDADPKTDIVAGLTLDTVWRRIAHLDPRVAAGAGDAVVVAGADDDVEGADAAGLGWGWRSATVAAATTAAALAREVAASSRTLFIGGAEDVDAGAHQQANIARRAARVGLAAEIAEPRRALGVALAFALGEAEAVLADLVGAAVVGADAGAAVVDADALEDGLGCCAPTAARWWRLGGIAADKRADKACGAVEGLDAAAASPLAVDDAGLRAAGRRVADVAAGGALALADLAAVDDDVAGLALQIGAELVEVKTLVVAAAAVDDGAAGDAGGHDGDDGEGSTRGQRHTLTHW